MTELAKKISLTQAIHSMQQLFPEEFKFYPKSWIIPAQLSEFQQHSRSSSEKSWFIVKPDEGSQKIKTRIISRSTGRWNLSDKLTRAAQKHGR